MGSQGSGGREDGIRERTDPLPDLHPLKQFPYNSPKLSVGQKADKKIDPGGWGSSAGRAQLCSLKGLWEGPSMELLLNEAADGEKWPGKTRPGSCGSCSPASQRPDPVHQPQVSAQANIQDREGEQGQASPKQGGGTPTEEWILRHTEAPSRGQQPLEIGHNNCHCPGMSESPEPYPWA